MAAEPAAGPVGHVTLVGGGPGTTELLTVAAVKALRDADVVFYDRLAPYQELPSLTSAELVDVGKKPGHHKVSQGDIEKLMVESALAGNNVVRLKGGDPYVFGRGGEEVASCVAAGVPVRVISGVTSAISVPAAAGIPVTHREVSHMFTVVSGHAPLTEKELHAPGRPGRHHCGADGHRHPAPARRRTPPGRHAPRHADGRRRARLPPRPAHHHRRTGHHRLRRRRLQQPRRPGHRRGRGGVVINDDCATQVPGIWAIGEVANFGGMCLGLVAPANTMAEIVADRLHGGDATFPGFDTATKLKLMGIDVASFGAYELSAWSRRRRSRSSAKTVRWSLQEAAVFAGRFLALVGRNSGAGDADDYGKLLMLSKSDMPHLAKEHA